MALHYESIPLELPRDTVEESCGFSLDIGCSTAKLIYRSKDDYEGGKPKNEELQSDKGRVYLIPSIARTKVDDVIELIRSRCDLLSNGDNQLEIRTCGAGCSFFRKRIETALNVKLKNLIEFECFIRAFHLLATRCDESTLFYPVDEKAVEEGTQQSATMAKLFAAADKSVYNLAHQPSVPAEVDTADESIFPCIIAMCGSGYGFMRINADGTWTMAEGSMLGGRMFLGLSALLTGEKDFSKIYAAIERGSHESVDDYVSDMLDMRADTADDSYSAFKGVDRPVIPFGKAVRNDPDTIKDDDKLHSLYHAWCKNVVHIGSWVCRTQKVRNLYFCGNFVETPRARYWLTLEQIIKNARIPEGEHVRVRCIRHGGHLGSLGAFMKPKEEAPTTEATAGE